MSPETSFQTVQAEQVRETRPSLPAARGAAPAGPPVDIASVRCGGEYVVLGRVQRILIPGRDSGDPGCCRIGDGTGAVWLLFPGLATHADVHIDELIRAGGLVVEDRRGLAFIDPWVAPVG